MKKTNHFIVFAVIFLFSMHCAQSQEPLKVDAGEDRHYCFESDWIDTTLGGNPTAFGGIPPYTYRWWANPDYLIFMDNGAMQANPNVTFLGGFVAYVEVTDAVDNIAIDSVIITVSHDPYSFPLPSLGIFPITYYISQGDSVWITIDDIIYIEESYTICNWETVPISGNCTICSSFWVKPEATTSYYLTVTDEHGCSEKVITFDYSPIYKIYVDEVGIKDNLPNDKVSIFPNPVDETLYFSNETAFEIMDMQGRVLLKSEKPVQSVNVSSLKAGIYFIRFDGGRVQKFVKE